jgi:hypothetical protein
MRFTLANVQQVNLPGVGMVHLKTGVTSRAELLAGFNGTSCLILSANHSTPTARLSLRVFFAQICVAKKELIQKFYKTFAYNLLNYYICG